MMRTQKVNYKWAVHAFTKPAASDLGKLFDMNIAYNREADMASWQKLTDFLDQTIH
ncbi:MAG: hypothetical protein ACPGLV_15735 [Bacteroidia bacterium]